MNKIEIFVEDIEHNLKDDVRRAFKKLAEKFGLEVFVSNISYINGG